jgi:predicted type IV restriction endonuclease
MVLKGLLEAIERVKDRAEKSHGELQKSEALTRYVLIDPILRALGWDTEDPS